MLSKMILITEKAGPIKNFHEKFIHCTNDRDRIALVNTTLKFAAERNDIALLTHLFKTIERVPQELSSGDTGIIHYGTHENLIGDISEAEALIDTYIPAQLRFIFETPQRGKFHKEGPALKHHLQAMLLAIRDICAEQDNTFSGILPPRYRQLIRGHRTFFELFSLLHDIGKATTLRLKMNGAITYPQHELRSITLMKEHGEELKLYNALTPDIFNELQIVIRHHSEFFDEHDIAPHVVAVLNDRTTSTPWFEPRTVDLLICAIFLDMAWPAAPSFNEDMQRIRNGIKTWAHIRPL